MDNETTTIHFRVNRRLKEQAEKLFKDLGVNMTDAMIAFLTNCVQTDSIPFIMIRFRTPGTPTRDELKAEREEHMRMLRLLDARMAAIKKKEKYKKSLHNPFISEEIRLDMARRLMPERYFSEKDLEEYTMRYYEENYDLSDVDWGDSPDDLPGDASGDALGDLSGDSPSKLPGDPLGNL